jgi:DNA-binding transcriptional LysR family regulator
MSDIETRLFRYFAAVAEEQHFGHAAVRLGISPPTLTHQIQKLEGQLGVRLLVRKGNSGVLLTEEGQSFFADAREVLKHVDQAATRVRQARRGQAGRLNVGFNTGASFGGLLITWIGEFQRANPKIYINVRKLLPPAQIAGIMRNELDAGFTRALNKYPAGIRGFEVYRQPLVLALPKDHHLASRKDITPAMLKDEPFVNITPELDAGFWGYAQTIGEMGKFAPRVVRSGDDFTTILTQVALGYGIAVIPELTTRMNVANIVYKEIASDSAPMTSIAFVYRREASPTANLLIKHMRRYALPPQRTGPSGPRPERPSTENEDAPRASPVFSPRRRGDRTTDGRGKRGNLSRPTDPHRGGISPRRPRQHRGATDRGVASTKNGPSRRRR